MEKKFDESMKLRFVLLRENGYDTEKAQKCLDFINAGEPEAAAGLADGIYLIGSNDQAVKFIDEDTEKPEGVKYVGIVMGSRRLAVALTDAADGKDVTLTEEEAEEKEDGAYFDTYIDAVADWDGKKNTENLKKQGLNDSIDLQPGEYIPSLGELYLIYINRKALNKALAFVGGLPIGNLWYWSSTEYSAPTAWYLFLTNGYATSNPKAAYKGRVRPVSAFLPLNL